MNEQKGNDITTEINPAYPPRKSGSVGNVDGKVIVVTGATGMVGRELTPLLITSGASVIAIGRNTDRLNKLGNITKQRLSSLTSAHPSFNGKPTASATEFGNTYAASRVADQLHPMLLDLENQDETILKFEEIINKFGKIDAVIHLVGGWTSGGVTGFEPEKLMDSLANQVIPVANLTTAILDHLVSSSGRFIAIGSNASQEPSGDNTLYASVKAATDAWVSGLASAFKGSGASATTILINAVLTESLASKHPDRDFTGWTPDHLLARKIVEVLEMEYTNGVRLAI